MAAIANTSALKIMREYCSLAFGPGQVSFKDYTRLRLFDNGFYPDKRAVVGQRKNSDIDLTINYRHDWIGLFANKVASASYLAAHGFPTIPVLGIYAEKLASASPVDHSRRCRAEGIPAPRGELSILWQAGRRHSEPGIARRQALHRSGGCP